MTLALAVITALVASVASSMTSRPGHVTTTATPLPPAAVDVGGGCGQLSVDDVWVSGFAKLMTESAVRLLDVNADGVLDVLLGFATGKASCLSPSVDYSILATFRRSIDAIDFTSSLKCDTD